MDFGIDRRVTLVTGASKGIGLGIATELAAEGARVAISSRSRERIDASAEPIGARPFVHDTSDVNGAPGLIDAVEAELGPVEILVCNTGGPPVAPDALGFTREQWEVAYRSLVLTPMALIERVVPGMRERSWGRVINVSSSAVREPLAAIMLSNVHRSGMLAAFKTLARQLASDNVTCNTVLAGRIATDRMIENAGSLEAAESAAAAEVPAGRPGTVEEFAAAAAFLCSQRASYITGAALPVDGGLLRSV
jgi:3-oxoacyl-[acyl-carrier protein] reductase